jgi:hypothetical protein
MSFERAANLYFRKAALQTTRHLPETLQKIVLNRKEGKFIVVSGRNLLGNAINLSCCSWENHFPRI